MSVLTSLEDLYFQFESPRHFPYQESQHPFPPTRSVLPALTTFRFRGTNKYLEDFVARIDTPRLCQLDVTFFTFFHDIDFDTPELIKFVNRSSTFNVPIEAHVFFGGPSAFVKLQPQASYVEYFKVCILCSEPNLQLSFLARFCTTSSPLLSTTENLVISEPVDLQLDWRDDIENTEWLDLLRLFTVVKNLYLSKRIAPRIATALQDPENTGGGTTGVLSTLQNLYLEGFEPSEPVQEGITQFISVQQLTNHPVAISVWDRPGAGEESEEDDD